MSVASQFRSYLAVLPKARHNRLDLLRWLIRRPQLLAATATYEIALATSARTDSRLKALAELKVATLITCDYCIDLGSALARSQGITEIQLRALSSFRTSKEFTRNDKFVLELAEAMTRIPTVIDDDFRARLLTCFSRSQLAELMSAIAWENHRGRLNQALGVSPSGYSEGTVCAKPEPGPS